MGGSDEEDDDDDDDDEDDDEEPEAAGGNQVHIKAPIWAIYLQMRCSWINAETAHPRSAELQTANAAGAV